MRNDRRHTKEADEQIVDMREPSERDRDRILYSAAFRRLAGITQTVPVDLEHPVHNRLTHVLEVAQIGRRLTQRLLRNPTQKELAMQMQLDPEVVAAACFAHDLGHPPYGHIAEEILDEMTHDAHSPDGFEGNAQSFRVVTKLAEHKPDFPGLDLTRATLNAIIKYPWSRGTTGKEQSKWNYYSTEEQDFNFAREPNEQYTKRKSAEAALMDWADDIAYSVHDMLDFYQAGKIPLDRLGRKDDEEVGEFLDGVRAAWADYKLRQNEKFGDYATAFKELARFFTVQRPFAGHAQQRYALKKLSSFFIERYAKAVRLQQPTNITDPFIVIDKPLEAEVTMLKELTWHYVIRDPALASQQQGQRQIIKSLFEIYEQACHDRRKWRIFPPRLREIAAKENVDDKDNNGVRCRLVCDIIAGMSEQQAEAMYKRLNGIATGSAFATIIR